MPPSYPEKPSGIDGVGRTDTFDVDLGICLATDAGRYESLFVELHTTQVQQGQRCIEAVKDQASRRFSIENI